MPDKEPDVLDEDGLHERELGAHGLEEAVGLSLTLTLTLTLTLALALARTRTLALALSQPA